jgi:hypothetical protein
MDKRKGCFMQEWFFYNGMPWFAENEFQTSAGVL